MKKEAGGESGSAGGELKVGGKGGWGEIIVLVTLCLLRSNKPEMVGKMLKGENKYKIKAHSVCS